MANLVYEPLLFNAKDLVLFSLPLILNFWKLNQNLCSDLQTHFYLGRCLRLMQSFKADTKHAYNKKKKSSCSEKI